MYPRMYSTLTTTSGRGGPARSPAKPRSKNAAPVSIEVERRSALVAANHAIQVCKICWNHSIVSVYGERDRCVFEKFLVVNSFIHGCEHCCGLQL